MRDTTERKLSEEYREMGREILQVLNQPEDFQDSIQQLLNILKTRTKFDAVGIRMQDGDDFPYIAQEGFSKAFLKTENSLIERSADGGLCRDKDGNVQLECTCGLIISGKTDPSNPLFTKGGSAWTNDSLPLLDIPPEEDPRNHPRNMCIHQGYASIALVPIRNMDRIIGTIQLNDRRKGCLTLERVELLEGIASHIGAALMRKQAEEALRESVKKYQLLADNLTDVIWTRDLNLKITYISPSIYAQSGFTPAEKMQLPIQDTMTQESLSLIGQIFGEELNIEKTETGNPNRSRTVDIEMCHKNGSIYPVEVSVSFLRNKDGKAYGLLGVTRDITKRKQVEKKIRESEKNFRDLTENLMDGIAIIDENGNHIFTNPKYSEITGYSNEELQKITGWDLTRPEDVNLLKQRMEKRIEGKSHIKNYERIIVRKDGTELQAEMSTTTTLWQGKMRPMAIIRDITERKLAEDTLRESEERYRILATNTQDTIWMADLEFNLTYINGAIFNFLGYTAEEITCLKLADFTPPAGRQMIQNAVEQLLANYNQGKSSQVTIELQHYRKDRTIIDAEITANLLIDTDGKFIGFQGRSVDISERKRGHLTLQKSEKRFRDMADLLPQVVFEMDLSGKLTYVNRSAFDIFGYTPEELDEGVNVFDIIPPEEHSRVKENIHKALIGETRRNHEYTALRRDGSRFPISIYSSPVISNGNAIGLRGIVVDITEHKLAEEEHRKSEQRFRNIVDNSPMGVHMYELQSEDRLVFIGANPAANSLLGVDNSIFIGKTIEEAFPPLAQTEVVLRYKEAAKSGIPWSTEQISYEDDQITGAFEVAAFQTAPGKMVALFNNITNRKQAQEALKESEERYRRLFEDDLAGNYISTPIGEIITCNLAFARIFGFDSVDEILLTQIESLYINQQDRKDFLQLLGERRKLEFYEKEFRHKTGHTLHIIENAVGAFDESHNLIQIRGHIIDNTEHKQLEDQLRQSQKMEGIGRLAGGIAHDFNNLMTSIMCNAELSLMDLDTNDPLNKNMKEIQTTAERAGALTSQLLAFSRKQSLQPRVLNLNSQISEIRNMLIRTIGEDIDLRVILGDDIWMVKADPGQIDQVIVNLVVNARDAMPNGGELTLETQNVVLEEEYTKKHHLITPGNFVMLAVSDSGIGMSEEVIAKIFEPFFTTKLKTTGTGLGLSTVYGIIKQSNGMINVFSEPDNGSSFRIYLPTIAEKAEKIIKSDFSGSVPRGTETVLIIEDEEGVRKAAAMVLKRLGYKITEADSGAAALILCKRMQKQVDLVITDVVMPYMSGVEFVEQLCEIWHDVKVLFMSGYTENSIIHKKILKPGIPYMQKPFRTLDIALKVREVLDS
ncbi:MAG: PAS domain S-box protein [Calditrichaeota bacterium]|nr:PAS domain S-box protein [Calditrichota bacterium]